MRARKEEITKRREEGYKLLLQGFSMRQVAKQYGVSSKQIEKDLEFIRKKKRIDINKLDLNDKLFEYNESARLRLRKIWEVLADRTSNKRNVLHAIKLLREEDEFKMRREQMVGILPRDKVININNFGINDAEAIKIEFGEIEMVEDKQQEDKDIIDAEIVEDNSEESEPSAEK